MLKKNFRFRATIAILWLLLIYLFLPFGPSLYNFLFKDLKFHFVRQLLALASVCGALLIYLPFAKKFKLNRAAPYIITTVVLAVACAINVSLKIPARTLHIPEYAILSIFLYSAFKIKYAPKKSYTLAIIIGTIAGILDERIIQYLLPMRYYDLGDILLNTAGVTTGIFLVLAYNMPVHK